MTNVAAGGDTDAPDVTSYAVRGWGSTARLCAVRLAEAVPAIVSVVWLILRR